MQFVFGLRATTAALCALVPFAAANAAYEFPKIEDAKARAMLERTGMTPQKLEQAFKFAKPAPQEWPCEAPKAEMLTMAGLMDAIPADQLSEEHRKTMTELARVMRKTYRDMGMDPAAGSKNTYSNLTLVPIKAQCVEGKVEGEVDYFVSYDKVSVTEIEQYSPHSQKMEKTKSTSRSSAEQLMRVQIANGKVTRGGSTLSRMKVSTSFEFSNPALKPSSTPPQDIFNATYTFADGQVTFSPMASTEISSGFLGPKVSSSTKLMTMVTVIGDKHNDTFTYNGTDYTGSMRQNRETNTMLSITYMDNFAKKLGQKVSEMPGMSHMKEVVMNGKDMLETRTCTVDYKPVKIEPCPVE